MKNRIWSALGYLSMVSAILMCESGVVSAASFPIIEITPMEIDFGTVDAGSNSQPVVVTVGNKPGATFTLAVLKIEIKGPSALEFSIIDDNVTGSAMDGGMSSTLSVVFKPTKPGQHSSDLIISANGGINLEIVDYPVPLSGNAGGGWIPASAPVQSNIPVNSLVPWITASAGGLPPTGAIPTTYSFEAPINPGSDSPHKSRRPRATRLWLAAVPLAVVIMCAVIWRRKRGKRGVVKPPG